MRSLSIINPTWALLFVLTALFALPACGATAPSQELVDARKAYQEAKQSAASRLRPDELVDAHKSLEAAEVAHKEDAGGVEERHLAYLAQRRAQIAKSRGEHAALENEYGEKHRQVSAQAKSYAYEAKDQLSDANEELQARAGKIQATEQELAEERRLRKEAEQLAAKALNDLKEVAMVKEESRGYVITLSGSVLFKSGASDLLSTARVKLQQVAEALKQQGDKSIVVEGHTDGRGSDSYNQTLSLQRAQSVREFLVSEGIDPSSIEAQGMGESQPIADNNTPEGRANNRRVEIVVKD